MKRARLLLFKTIVIAYLRLKKSTGLWVSQLQYLAEPSSKLWVFLIKSWINYNKLKYFTYDHKKPVHLGKFYLSSKIHETLPNIPWSPVISNCGMWTKMDSEFLNYHVKPAMQRGTRTSIDFIKKMKKLQIISGSAIFVTTNVIGFIIVFYMVLN